MKNSPRAMARRPTKPDVAPATTLGPLRMIFEAASRYPSKVALVQADVNESESDAVADGADAFLSCLLHSADLLFRVGPARLTQVKSGRRATVTGVNGQRTFSDGTRTVNVHFIEGSPHAQGFMMAWLPRERLLVDRNALAAPDEVRLTNLQSQLAAATA